MGDVLLILGPIFLLITLGAGLQWGGFFKGGTVSGLNRLCYWVALPGLIFGSLARGGPGAGGGFAVWEWTLLGVLIGTTLLAAFVGWGVASAMGLAWGSRGTFAQAIFRGNLAFVGLPILLKVPGVEATRVLLLMAPMMIVYNVLAVSALVLSKHGGAGMGLGEVVRTMLREWLRNPILWASILGSVAFAQGWVLPEPLGESVGLVGRMAVPLALVTIGAVLLSLPTGAWGGVAWIAVAGKVALSPLIGWVMIVALGIKGLDQLIILVILACPTAVASYTMAEAMGGDEAMAAQTVVGSTVASAAMLALILALAG